MAKEKTNKTTEVSNVVVNEENIVETIKNGNKMTEDILKAAQDQIQKEKDEKKQNELKEAILKADFINKAELLELRKRRGEEKATKTALTAYKDVLDELKSGQITPTEYDKKLQEIDTQKAKSFSEVDKEHRENYSELCNGFNDYFDWDWEYSRRRRRW